jgi:hypothetical protein
VMDSLEAIYLPIQTQLNIGIYANSMHLVVLLGFSIDWWGTDDCWLVFLDERCATCMTVVAQQANGFK